MKVSGFLQQNYQWAHGSISSLKMSFADFFSTEEGKGFNFF